MSNLGATMAPEILEEELATYREHRDELLGRAEGQWVLIHRTEIYGTFTSQQDAINEGYRKLGNVAFLVEHIVDPEVPETFVSNHVVF